MRCQRVLEPRNETFQLTFLSPKSIKMTYNIIQHPAKYVNGSPGKHAIFPHQLGVPRGPTDPMLTVRFAYSLKHVLAFATFM